MSYVEHVEHVRKLRQEFATLTDTECEAYAALTVIQMDAKTRRFLEENDPKALNQVENAIRAISSEAEVRFREIMEWNEKP